MNLDDLNGIPPWEWPESAAEIVMETLGNRAAPESKRLLAAELAGDMVILDEEIANALLKILRSKEEPAALRSQAAISLGPGLEEAEFTDYDDPDDSPAFSESFLDRIQHSLHELFLDSGVPKDVRRSILEASVRNAQLWHTAAIKQAYSSDPEWQLTAVFCMQFVQGFDDEILEALKSPEPKIHFHAIEAAGNWELDAAWPHIMELVSSEDTEKSIRIAAISAAASIRPQATEALLEPLVDSYDEDIAEAAMDALAEAEYAFAWDSEDEETEEDEDEPAEDDEDKRKI